MPNKPSLTIRENSFAHRDDAETLCWLLSFETGQAYRVLPDNQLGFTAKPINNRLSLVESVHHKSKTLHEQRSYRQSFLGFLPHYAELALGLLIVQFHTEVLTRLLQQLAMTTLPAWVNLAAINEAIKLSGMALILWSLRFLYRYFASVLRFTPDGILLKKGLIARNEIFIRYGDIKSLGVKQSILGRLLGIGALHLDSAATNGDVDIVFDNLRQPLALRNKIQTLIDQPTQRG